MPRPGCGSLSASRGKRAGRYAGFCTTEVVTAISLGAALPQPSSGLPGNSASSLNVPCLTLLRTRFTQRARSLGPLVVSYTTVSPLPRSPKRPWRSALCCTFSRIAPGGCYPPSCSVEPGRSSAPGRSRMTRPSGRPVCVASVAAASTTGPRTSSPRRFGRRTRAALPPRDPAPPVRRSARLPRAGPSEQAQRRLGSCWPG